ncbi:hypothetical protein DFS34DRAFT_189261 [Phlyctochytrium arcticum]|nr:hypothetical protein DFS34DRAFT_189261 [Phlyctochytrium arcticum]
MNPVFQRTLLASRQGILSRTTGVPTSVSLGLSAPRFARAYDHYKGVEKAKPDTLRPVAHEIWSREQSKDQATPAAAESTDVYTPFEHPIYTPPSRPYTGIGPLAPPLKFPEYDQKTPSAQASGLPSPPNWWESPFDNDALSPIGEYPRITPQWSQLKDPYKYWDQQGRRNYGEILYDHDNFMDQWGIGPEQHWWPTFKIFLQWMAVLGSMGVAVHWAWSDPMKILMMSEKDWPMDGLRVQLGADPNNPDDTSAQVGCISP